MPRIRTVKPEMWTDGKVVRLSDAANLLFIALLNQADDSGRLKNDPIEIECRAPRFWQRSAGLIDELKAVGLVTAYGDGGEFLQIPNFNKHQVIDRPRPSEIPHDANDLRTFDERSPNNRRKEGKGKEGKGKEGVALSAHQPSASRFMKPNPSDVAAYALTIGYKLNGSKFCDFYESKGWRVGNSPMKNWRASVRTWKTKDTSPASAPMAPAQPSAIARDDMKKQEADRKASEEEERAFARDFSAAKSSPDYAKILTEAKRRIPLDAKFGIESIMIPAKIVEVYRELAKAHPVTA